MAIKAAIKGVGGYVPDYVLTNAELEKMVDTNNEWILERTGISERRILKGDKGTSYLGARAVENLLEKTNTKAEDIDLIICATVTADMHFPAAANMIAHQVGAKNAFSYDINAACSGFVYALSTGSQFIETGRYKKVVIVGADKMSSIVDYTDRTTCVLFGDGAGAVLLEPTEAEEGVMDFVLKTDGAGEPHLHMKAGGSLHPPTHQTIDDKMHYIYQEGMHVFKHAVVSMADVSAEIMERNNLGSDDIAYLVPHQANKRIIDATANRMGVGEEKVMMNIHKYGNTTAATIPLCLMDYENKLKKGDNLVFAAFGGGFTWGAAYIKWAY
ncbi:beta-ketoacyl-ACP synthase 3 [Flammeovirga yaeyamensis]|uniref:Beta-ketoacyl-[acyl-carrier-protein] synthase III n=1 Tax=Flammeovirga yaeyamensis TaxID=367791 RepID=A0AAX1MXS7_9BACT|nr:beta-ketoacyl-ACP synthase III [Flammeovirga yaeyamensis]MBB3696362.1 3-oxoacyl-[acyl-carrier-protein] synthase-3 [Flammeovirga yaeyamensis]NMF35041.1 ketoacyl-ACP synthase III [Flammeovirga yaeyamensis]QWG00135.1 beta-ketoacyl-ACP synthase 3 [Flammeovirga yaeyamensis]